MVRVPHHDPEHGGSIFLTTLSMSMGRRIRVEDRPREARRRTGESAWYGVYLFLRVGCWYDQWTTKNLTE